MDRWNSLTEIIKEFSLSPDSSNVTARASLLMLLAEVHPDKTSGEFANGEVEARYHAIQSAIQFVEELQRRAASLVPYVENSVTNHRIRLTELKSNETILRNDIGKSLSRKYKSAKFGSVAIGGAILGVMAFSSKLIENPIVSNLLSYADQRAPFVRPAIGVLFLLGIIWACLAFSAAWKREYQENSLAESIISDAGIEELFKSYPLSQIIEKDGKFSIADVVNGVQFQGKHIARSALEFLPFKLFRRLPAKWRYRKERNVFNTDTALANRTAELIVEKLELRKALLPISNDTIAREYRLSEAARKQLEDS